MMLTLHFLLILLLSLKIINCDIKNNNDTNTIEGRDLLTYPCSCDNVLCGQCMTGCQPSTIGCTEGKPRNFCYCNIVDTTCNTDPYEACGLAPSNIPTKSPTPVPTKKPSPVPTRPTFIPTSSPSSTSPSFYQHRRQQPQILN